MRTERLTKEEKHEITKMFKQLRLLPDLPCQVVLHCHEGTVQAIEYQGLKLK